MKGSAVVQFKGGPGSGHHSHAGRPGKVGGSVSGSGPRRAIDYAGKSKKPYIDEGPTGWKADKHSITRVDYDVAIPISLLRSERVDLVRTADVESPRTFEYRQELMESMRDEGQKVPIDVAVEMDGSITIIDGTHRIEAASLLGWSHIYGDVRYFGNSQRNGLITEDSSLRMKGGPGSGHRGHKGRIGKRGGSVPGTGDTGSMSIADRMYNLCIDGTEEQKNEIASLAEMANITLDNLEGLNGISFDHPAGMRYDWAPDHNSFIYIDDYDRGYLIVGSYDVENKVIHIAPAGMTTNTLAHEVGHHVQFTQIGVDNPKFTARVAVMAGKYNDIVMFNLTARVAGLRSYSFSSALEFYADSFSVMKQGLENQKKFLVDLWKEGGLGDPSAIIKELMTTDTLD